MFDRFQIVLGHYVYYLENHSGQWSEEYERMCKISKYFSPGYGYNALNLDTEENEIALLVYNNLADKNNTKHYSED